MTNTLKNKSDKFTFTKKRKFSIPGVIKNIAEIKGNGFPTSVRLFPRNTPEILFNLADPLEGEFPDKEITANGCTIQGSKSHYAYARHPKECHFMSIRFSPNGFYKLFGVPQNRFTDNLYQLDDVSNNAETLIPLLYYASSQKERFRILIEWLKKEASNREIPSDLLSDFIIRQLSRNPSLPVNKLVDKTGYSRKHLVQIFKEEAGMTIKRYQKINRMYRVLKYIQTEHPTSWAKLACDFGFYDQSHFIRDFKRHTGYTPTEYIQPVPSQKAWRAER